MGLWAYLFHNTDIKTKWGNIFNALKNQKCLNMSTYALLPCGETLKAELWQLIFLSSLFVIKVQKYIYAY